MTTTVIIVHGWEGKPDSNWFVWLKEKLEEKGVRVFTPQFPPDKEPLEHDWTDVLDANAHGWKEVVLVGHSLGVITILRYLQAKRTHVRAAILVAGFARPINIPELQDFFKTPLDFDAIKNSCSHFRVISSDDDPSVPQAEGEYLAHMLNVPLSVEKGKKHFNDEANIKELPIVLHAVLAACK